MQPSGKAPITQPAGIAYIEESDEGSIMVTFEAGLEADFFGVDNNLFKLELDYCHLAEKIFM